MVLEGRGRDVAAAAAAVVGALVLVACGDGPAAPAADAGPAGEVRALLRQRADLLAEGDVAGYLAAVRPSAEGTERALAEGAAAVPVSWANVSLQPRPGARSTESTFRDAEVDVVFRYEGLPEENLFRFSLDYDLELEGGSWVITGSRFAGRSDPPPIWATGPVASSRSEHFLALHRPGLAGAGDALDAAEQGWRGLAARLPGFAADDVHLVLLAGSDEEYAAIKGSPDEGEVGIARARSGSLSEPEGRHMVIKAHEIVLGDATAAAEDGAQAPAAEVFQHELAHLALTGLDGPFTPSWVSEGAAMYLAEERRVDAWAFGRAEGVFAPMSVGRMDRGGLADGLEYAYANAAVLHLVEEFGAERFFDFYGRFRPLSPSGDFLSDPTAVTLDGAYGLTVQQLDERTRAYIDRAAGG